ncbi:MAG TPA: winged helix-turn-helix domain-containing protein, partial [Paraburkholderia sp.]|nr:winged helix-turn-helix domain-containing protein [Paraburkholderia sp.]
MIELQLERDRRSAPTLVDQLVRGFAEAIEAQALRSGAQLPSVRQLAQTYQLSTFTVMEAYNRLVSMGLVVARRGSGHRVATQGAPAPRVSASDWQPPS